MFSDELRNQLIRDLTPELERDEGERRKPYKDSRGFWTVGIGHLLEGLGREVAEAVIGHPIDDAAGITEAEEMAIFEYDISRKMVDLAKILPWVTVLDEPRIGALVNMAFNMGAEKLSTFNTFLDRVKSGDYEGAAADLHSTLWASQVGKAIDPPGRATRICRQIQNGVWV